MELKSQFKFELNFRMIVRKTHIIILGQPPRIMFAHPQMFCQGCGHQILCIPKQSDNLYTVNSSFHYTFLAINRDQGEFNRLFSSLSGDCSMNYERVVIPV